MSGVLLFANSTRSGLEDPQAVNYPILVAAATLIIAFVLMVRARQLSRKAMERDGLSRFRDSFRGRYPEILLSQVYTYLAENHGAVMEPHWVISPSDNLRTAHGLADLDLEDAVLVIADRAGARLPRPADLDGIKDSVHTVDDLLHFLEPYFRPEVVKG